MKKRLDTTELVEVNGEIVSVHRTFDAKGDLMQERLENRKGESLAVTNIGWNSIRLFGSVIAWLGYRKATKAQRAKLALDNLSLAETPAELAEAQEAVALSEWDPQPDGWDGDCPIYGGIGWC